MAGPEEHQEQPGLEVRSDGHDDGKIVVTNEGIPTTTAAPVMYPAHLYPYPASTPSPANTGYYANDTVAAKMTTDGTMYEPTPPPYANNLYGQEEKIPAHEQGAPANKRICGLQRKTFLIIAVIATLIVLAAVIGGAVGGTVGRSSPSGDGINTQRPGSGAPNTTINPNIPRGGISQYSSLATVNYTDPAGQMWYRLIFQNEQGFLSEAAAPAGSQDWEIRPITNDSLGIQTKVGTPITAIAEPSLQVNVFWMDNENTIHEIFNVYGQTGVWLLGGLNGVNYAAQNGSSLAIADNPRLLYWQLENQTLSVANFSSGAWVNYALPGTPQPRTPIAPVSDFAGMPGETTVLFAQYFEGHPSAMVNVSWTPGDSNSTDGWPQPEMVNPDVELNVDRPFTAFSYFPLGSNGERAIHTMRPSEDASELEFFSFVDSQWDQTTTIQAVNGQGKRYTALASNADGQLFAAFQDALGPALEHWKLDQSGEQWSLVAMVNLRS